MFFKHAGKWIHRRVFLLNPSLITLIFVLSSFFFLIILTSVARSTPSICFTDPTPVDGDAVPQTWVFINTSTTGVGDTTAFIDWENTLRLWLRFNNETGESNTFFKDWSSFGNNCSCFGSSCPNYTNGVFNKSLHFNAGDSKYIHASDSSSLDINNEITIEAWIKLDSVTSNSEMILTKGSSSTNSVYWLYVDSSGKLKGGVNISGVGCTLMAVLMRFASSQEL